MPRLFFDQRYSEYNPHRGATLTACLLMIIITGCWTEVPYEENVNNPSGEEVQNETIAEESVIDKTSPINNDEEESALSEQVTSSDSDGQVVDAPPESTQKSLLPWQTSGKSDETPDLFSKSKPVTPEAIQSQAEESDPSDTPSESEDEFGSFLAEQYEGLLSDTEVKQEAPRSDTIKQSKPSVVSMPVPKLPEPQYGYQPAPLPGTLDIPDLKKRKTLSRLTEEEPNSVADQFASNLPLEAIKPESNDLKQDDAKPINPKVIKEDFLANDSPPEEIIVQTPEPIVGDRYQNDPFDVQPFDVDPPEVDSLEANNKLPVPVETEKPLTKLSPKAPSAIEVETPRLASLDPLPAVPVLRYNTRHLAWLLGGKIGLARLADLEGATSSEITQWSRESNRLATQLEVPIPAMSSDSDSVGRRVKSLLDASAELGESMAKEHGTNHAALLEISLKTNALLVLCKKYPELAAPTARAVERAAERAELPGFLWRRMTKTLLADSTPDEIFEAVTVMHANVESYLR